MRFVILFNPPKDIIARTTWYVYIRWYILLAIGAPGLLTQYLNLGWGDQVRLDIMLGAIALGSNAVFFLLTRLLHDQYDKYYRILAGVLLAIDTSLVTYLIFTKGGIESRNVILYTLPILLSAALFGRKLMYLVTGLSIAMYDALIAIDYFGPLHTVGAYNPELKTHGMYVLETTVYFSAILLIIGVIVDYLTRLLAEKEQQALANLERLRRAQEIAKLGSWEWTAEGFRTLWPARLYTVLGMDPDAVIKDYRDYLAYVHPDDRKLVGDTLKRALKSGSYFRLDHRTNNETSSQFVHLEGQLFRDAHGEVIRMVGTAQDVTESKLLDEAKTDFVGLASHQLRTPATGVKQYIGMLLAGMAGKLTAEQKKLLQVADECNERQLIVINDLLHVAQLDAGHVKLKRSPVDLVDLVREVIAEQSQIFAGTNCDITVKTSHKRIVYPIDAQRFRMVLENLINNAYKYTLPDKKIMVRMHKYANRVVISVKDEGVGIAPQDISRLFDKFSRIDNPVSVQVGGTGLGLYWANKLVTLHGGKMEVKSRLGVGTDFSIVLPLPR